MKILTGMVVFLFRHFYNLFWLHTLKKVHCVLFWFALSYQFPLIVGKISILNIWLLKIIICMKLIIFTNTKLICRKTSNNADTLLKIFICRKLIMFTRIELLSIWKSYQKKEESLVISDSIICIMNHVEHNRKIQKKY